MRPHLRRCLTPTHDDSFKARMRKSLVPLCVCAVVIHAHSPDWKGRRAAGNWPSGDQPCLTAALLSRVSTGFSHRQHNSVVLPQACCLRSCDVLHSLPTGNLLQLTSETEPTLGSPPEGQRTAQKWSVCRNRGFSKDFSSQRALRTLQKANNRAASSFRALKHKDR